MRNLGRSGLAVSALGLGTMTWGRDTDEYEAQEQAEFFVEHGGNLIDTADVFGEGAALQVLGSVLQKFGPSHFVVSAKTGLTTDPERRHNSSRNHLVHNLDATLRTLKRSHLDIWMIHGFDRLTPLDELARTLDLAVENGKANYVGLSNFSSWQISEVRHHMRNSESLIACSHEYSLVQRGIDRDVLPYLRHAGVGLIAWSGLGRGTLSGKYRHAIPADSRAASPHWGVFTRSLLTETNKHIIDAVCTAAEGLGKNPTTVSLAWALAQPGISSVLTGARNAQQLRHLLKDFEADLPGQILNALSEISAPETSYPDSAAQR